MNTKIQPDTSKQGWEEEFDRRFPGDVTVMDDDGQHAMITSHLYIRDRLKDFIQQEIDRAAEETTRKERKRCLECVDLVGTSIMNPDYGYIEYIKDEIRDKIKEGK